MVLCREIVFEVESTALACLAGPGPVEPSRVGTDRAQRGGYVAGAWGVGGEQRTNARTPPLHHSFDQSSHTPLTPT